MSVELREVKRRIQGVRQIHKATSAMEKIASARLARDKAAAGGAGRYTERLAAILDGVLEAVPEVVLPLMGGRDTGPSCLVMFGSERGLCGGYNSALMDQGKRFHEEHAATGVRVISMGKVMNRRVERAGFEVDRQFHQPGAGSRTPGRFTMPGEVDELARLLVDRFLTGVYRDVSLLYFQYAPGLRQDVRTEPLLPIRVRRSASARRAQASPYDLAILEPAPADLLARMLPELVRWRVYEAFVNSMASETVARQVAMRRATDNAEEMLNELLLSYSRLRQEDITTQMLEIVGGSIT